MLEPTDIHGYEPPAYRVLPPSPTDGPLPSLHFEALILESPNSQGGPPPGLLRSLREQGCLLILARVSDGHEDEGRSTDKSQLDPQWFDAVFDKVLDDARELARYLMADAGIDPSNCLCYCCTEAGARAFADSDVGLIIAPSFDKVWEWKGENICRYGADLATPHSPTARQLSWLHKVFTEKFWCVVLWWVPAEGELKNDKGLQGDSPGAEERAELTRVASRTISARGHPPWSTQLQCEDTPPACTAMFDNENLACPDWTPLEPLLRQGPNRPPREVRNFRKVLLYCHTLDVGVAQVNHALEAEDADGVRVRVAGRRFVNLARPGQAAAELSVSVLDSRGKPPPDIWIRSSIRQDHIPPGFSVGSVSVELEGGQSLLTASFVDDVRRRVIEVKAWHRIIRDDGKGDVQLKLGGPEGGMRTSIKTAGPCAINVIFANPRKGTRYTVEKVISVTAHMPTSPPKSSPLLRSSSSLLRRESWSPQVSYTLTDEANEPPSLPEVEEEHRSAWRDEWDKADIEIKGTRKAVRCQRAARLFRYHQVSRGHLFGTGAGELKVPSLVRKLFISALQEVFDPSECQRPGALVTSRVLVHDPRPPFMIRIEPNLPPACAQLRFNAALGRRWHRFTFTSGAVKILVQGPLLATTCAEELHGDIVKDAPKFSIPSSEFDEGVEVRATPWHEVKVQHALTELGRPDGSAGGFYSLMRRTRYMRMEVLRRLLSDSDEDYRDSTLRQILHHALSGLQSAPRPPEWVKTPSRDNEDLHILEADATTRARVRLSYEKNELLRDIRFLEGQFEEYEGRLLAGSTIMEETMTLEEAKEACITMPGCAGFSFQGEASTGVVRVSFRDSWGELSKCQWTTFRYMGGEEAVEELLRSEHDAKVAAKMEWVDPELPSWDEVIANAEEVLLAVAEEKTKRFRNFITDRDGTTNNYCDRYASSIQSAYNGAWLSHFARHCTDNAVVITAAPLGGRPSAEGLMELSVVPRGVFTYTGSKGREYFNHNTQRVLQAEELPQDQRELVDELHRRLLGLCLEPGNTKFLGIGSGLQRKFGEVTMARNDPATTVPEPESRRFMAAVRKLKEDLDPDGTELDLHDTGTDLEIFPRSVGGRSFDKGSGVVCLDQKLHLHVDDGPNLVCGDTSSDLPMVVATLRLMCGDHMVETWQERIRREEEPPDHPEALMRGSESEFTDENEEDKGESEEDLAKKARQAMEQEEAELRAREQSAKLAVLFVIPPGTSEEMKKRKSLAAKVRKWCEISGARCAILPSPDALVATLVHYANKVAGRKVTTPPRGDDTSGKTRACTPGSEDTCTFHMPKSSSNGSSQRSGSFVETGDVYISSRPNSGSLRSVAALVTG